MWWGLHRSVGAVEGAGRLDRSTSLSLVLVGTGRLGGSLCSSLGVVWVGQMCGNEVGVVFWEQQRGGSVGGTGGLCGSSSSSLCVVGV